MTDYGERYWLSFGRDSEWKEVTKEEYISAERSAGFRPKFGNGIATAGFSNGSINGEVTYNNKSMLP